MGKNIEIYAIQIQTGFNVIQIDLSLDLSLINEGRRVFSLILFHQKFNFP